MLTKLLKYDLKYMIKNMSAFYILALLFSVLTRIFFSIDDSLIFYIIGQICVGTLISMLVSIIINTVLRSWVSFRDSVYKDESYLTHTLPVTKTDIYNSKFVQALIFFIVGFIIIIISLFIAYYTEPRWLMLKDYISSITTGLDLSTGCFVTSILFIIFLEIFNAIQCGFFGIIAGHSKNNHKLLYSIIFGFLVYIFAQVMVLGMMYVVALFDEGLMQLFTSNVLSNIGSFKLLINLTVILYIVIIVIMNFVCKKLFNKGVNVE